MLTTSNWGVPRMAISLSRWRAALMASSALVASAAAAAHGQAPAPEADLYQPHSEISLRANPNHTRGTIELFAPVKQSPDALLFVDLRLNAETGDSDEGGSVGVGIRRIFNNQVIVGGHFAYDQMDHSNAGSFEAISAGAEILTENFDVRVNYTEALSDPVLLGQSIAPGVGQAVVDGSSIVERRDALDFERTPFDELEVEFGARVGALELSDNHEFRVFAAGAAVEADAFGTEHVARGRFEYRINDAFDVPGARVTFGGGYVDDPIRGGEAFGEVRFRAPISALFGGGSSSRLSERDRLRARMTERVQRYSAPSVRTTVRDGVFDQAVRNPLTGLEFGEIVYVDAEGDGDGNLADPTSLNAGVGQAGDHGVIIVLSEQGAVETAGVTLLPGQQIAGAGGDLTVALSDGSLATVTAGSGGAATVQGTDPSQDVFTLARGVMMSGLTIEGGLSGVAGADLASFRLENVTISNSAGAGLRIDGMRDAVAFVDSLSVSGSGGDGIALSDIRGDLIFTGVTSVVGAGGDGVSIADSSGQIVFDTLNVDGAGVTGTGLVASNVSGLVAVSGGRIENVADDGVRATDANLALADMTVVGGSGEALDIAAVDSDITLSLAGLTLSRAGAPATVVSLDAAPSSQADAPASHSAVVSRVVADAPAPAPAPATPAPAPAPAPAPVADEPSTPADRGEPAQIGSADGAAGDNKGRIEDLVSFSMASPGGAAAQIVSAPALESARHAQAAAPAASPASVVDGASAVNGAAKWPDDQPGPAPSAPPSRDIDTAVLSTSGRRQDDSVSDTAGGEASAGDGVSAREAARSGGGVAVVSTTGLAAIPAAATPGAIISIDGSLGAGSISILSMRDLTLIGGGGETGGVVINQARFGDGTTGVAGGAWTVGGGNARITGAGLSFTDVSGMIAFDDLDIFNEGGTGFEAVGAAAGFGVWVDRDDEADSLVDTVDGAALDWSMLSAQAAFDTINASGAEGGLTLMGVAGAFSVSGGLIQSASGTAATLAGWGDFELTGLTLSSPESGVVAQLLDGASLTLNALDIEAGTGTGVQIVAASQADAAVSLDAIAVTGGSNGVVILDSDGDSSDGALSVSRLENLAISGADSIGLVVQDVAFDGASGGALTIRDAGLVGFAVTQSSGDLSFESITIEGPSVASASAMNISGGSLDLTISGATRLSDAGNRGLAIDDAAGALQLGDLVISDTGGAGVQIFTLPGQVRARSITASDVGYGVLISNAGESITPSGVFAVDGLLSVSDAANGGVQIGNAAGAVSIGSISIDGAGTDGVVVSGVSGGFEVGDVAVSDVGGVGLAIGEAQSALVFGDVAISGTGDDGVRIRGGAGSVSIGALEISDFGGNSGLDLVGFDLAGGLSTAALSITGDGTAGSVGIDLSGALNNRTITLGDSAGDAGADTPSAISGVETGVILTGADADFTFGDGEGATDAASTIEASGTLIDLIGLDPNVGVFNFADVTFIGDVTPLTGSFDQEIFYVDSTAGTGALSDPGSLAQAELSGADVIILINDGVLLDVTGTNGDDSFNLQAGQQVFSFANGAITSLTGTSGAPANIILTTVTPRTDFTIEDPTGNGAATLTGSGSSVITLSNDLELSGFDLLATGAADAIAGVGVAGVTISDLNVSASSGDGVSIAIASAVSGAINIADSVVNSASGDAISLIVTDAGAQIDTRLSGLTLSGQSGLIATGAGAGSLNINQLAGVSSTFDGAAGGAGFAFTGVNFDIATASGWLTANAASVGGLGLSISDSSGTLALGAVSITDASEGAVFNNNSLTAQFGGVTITGVGAGGTGVDLTGETAGVLNFGGLAISGSGAGSRGIDLTGAGFSSTVNTDQLDISGVNIGVDLTNAAITGVFIAGDGSNTDADGAASSISLTASDQPLVVTGVNGTTGLYNFQDVNLAGDISNLTTSLSLFYASATGTGAGTANDFGSLADAEAANVDVIVLVNDGSSIVAASTVSLDAGQQLISFGDGDVTLGGAAPANVLLFGIQSGLISDPTGNGAATLTSATDTLGLGGSNTVFGVTLESTGGTAIAGAGQTSDFTLQHSTITGATKALDLTGAQTGLFTIEDSVLTGGTGQALHFTAQNGARLLADRNTFASTGALAVEIAGLSGAVSVLGFADNAVTSGLGGVSFDSIAFGAGSAVDGGALTLGASGARIAGDGLSLTNVTGAISFDAVNAYTDGGTSLFVNNSLLNVSDFIFTIGDGVIDAVNGDGVNLDPLTVDITLSSVTASGGFQGIALDDVAGTFTVTGAVAISDMGDDGIDIGQSSADVDFQGQVTLTNIFDDGVDITDTTGALNFAGLTINGVGGNGLEIDNAAGAMSVSGALVIDDTGVDGVNVIDSTGDLTFASDVTLSNIGFDGLYLQTTSGSISLENLTITNALSSGIVLDDHSGAFTLNGLADINSVDAFGISILNTVGTTGTVDIASVDIDGADTGGVRIVDADITGSVGIDLLNVTGTTNSLVGLGIANSTGSVSVGGGLIEGVGAGETIGLIGNGPGLTLNFAAAVSHATAGAAALLVDQDDQSTATFTGASSFTVTAGSGFDFNDADGTYTLAGSHSVTGTNQTGILFGSDAAGAASFAGAVVLSTGTADAVSLAAGNTGSLVFTGDLDIDTTTGAGVNALGGTLGFAQAGQVDIASTGGAALILADVTADAVTGLVFDTLSAGGGTSGVSVDALTQAAATGLQVEGATMVSGSSGAGIALTNLASGLSVDFVGDVTVTNAGGAGVVVSGAADTIGLARGASLTVSNSGQAGLDLTGVTSGAISAGATTISGFGSASAGIDLTGSSPASVSFGVTTILNAGANADTGVGLDLSSTSGGGDVTFAAGSSISEVFTGVQLSSSDTLATSADVNLVFGDGEDAVDVASSIQVDAVGGASIDVVGLNAGLGTYNFLDADISQNFSFEIGAHTFVSSTAVDGAGDGTFYNPLSIADADALTGATSFVLLDGSYDFSVLSATDGFTLASGQNLSGFDNAASYAVNGAPSNVSGLPMGQSVSRGDAGTGVGGAVSVTSGAAGSVITLSGSNRFSDLTFTGEAGATDPSTIFFADGAAPGWDNTSGVTLQRLSILNLGAATGVSLSGVTGDFTFDAVSITGAGAGARGVDIALSGQTANFAFDGFTYVDAAGAGLDGIRLATTGAATASLTFSGAASTIAAGQHGVQLSDTGGAQVELGLANITLSGGSTAVEALNANGGVLLISAIDQVTVDSSDFTSGGIILAEAIFDADGNLGNGQQAVTGSAVIGSSLDRVSGAGLSLTSVSGTLDLTDLDIFNTGGDGLLVDNSVLAPGAFTFNVDSAGTADATVDTLSGTAINLDPLAVDMNFASVSATGGSNGIALDTVSGSFAVTGTTSISDTTGAGIVFSGTNTVTADFTGLTTITNPGTTGIVVGDTGTVTFGDVDITGLGANTTGVDLTGATGVVSFNTLDITASSTSNTVGIDLTGSTSANDITVSNPSSMTGLALGVDLDTANITGTFRYGDGEGVIDTASTIAATTALSVAGLNGSNGVYDFEDVDFGASGISNLSADVFWVAATPQGTGDGSTAANAGTLADAEAASNANIIILDTAGAGGQDTITGSITLDAGQGLYSFGGGDTLTGLGGAAANILLTGITSGTAVNPFTGSGAALLSFSGGDHTVTAASGATIQGLDITHTGLFAAIRTDSANNLTLRDLTLTTGGGEVLWLNDVSGTVLLQDLNLTVAGGSSRHAIRMFAAGDSDITLDGVTITSPTSHTGDGFNFTGGSGGVGSSPINLTFVNTNAIRGARGLFVNGGASTKLITLDLGGTTTLQGHGGFALAVDGADGTTDGIAIANLAGLTVDAAATGGSGGLSFADLQFDSDGGTAGFQTVGGGALALGAVGDLIEGAAFTTSNAVGALSFTDVDIFTDTTGNAFAVQTGDLDVTVATLDITGGSRGVRLTGAGDFTATGAVSISGTSSDGFNLSGTSGAITLQGLLTVSNAGADGIDISGASGAASFSGVTINGGSATSRGIAVGTSSTATFGATTITGTTGFGVTLIGATTGTVTFNGQTTIDNDGAGITGGGVDLDAGTLVFNGGLNIDTSSGVGFDGDGGTLAVADAAVETINTATGEIIDLTSVSLAAAGVTFDTLAASGTVVGEGVRLSGVAGTGAFDGGDVTVAGASLFGVQVINSGVTMNFASATIDNTGANAMFFTGSNGAITFNTVDIDGTSSGVAVVNNTNAFTISGGAIGATDDTTGQAVILQGGSGDVTIAADLFKTTANLIVDVTNRSGGTVTLSGDISATGSANNGVRVANNSGGAITFSGASKVFSTGANAAIDLATNTGATINFTGGGLDIDTTSGAGFNATGGGAVTIQGAGNTITSTTGTAVNIASTDIGAAGVTLESVSASGGSGAGIVLNTTGAVSGSFFEVTGTTGDCQTSALNCSGGSITGRTGDGVSLTDVQNVRLRRMNISSNSDNGLFGTSVNGLVLDQTRLVSNADAASPDEAGIRILELTGDATHVTAFTEILVEDSFEDNVQIINTTGTLTNLVVTDSIFRNDGASGQAGDNFELIAEAAGLAGAPTMTLTVDGSSFIGNLTPGALTATGLRADAGDGTITVNAGLTSGNTFTDNNVGINISTANAGSAVFDLRNNTVLGSRANAINLFTNASHTTSLSGDIVGNTIGTQGVADSGSQFGSGIRLANEGSGTSTLLIDSNLIQGVGDGAGNGFEGVLITDRVNAGTLALTITNNTIRDIFDDRAVFIRSRVGGAFTLNFSGNTVVNNTSQGAVEIDLENAASSTTTLANNTLTQSGSGEALRYELGASSTAARLAVSDNTFSSGGIGLDVLGATATLSITNFSGNTVTDAQSGGIVINNATFDADPSTAGIQTVLGGNTAIGTIGTRVQGDGLRLNNVLGAISFGDLDVFNNSGTGIFVRDAGGKAGSFAFTNTSGTINTTNGTALDIDPVTMNSVFDSISASGGTNGILLDTVDGSFVVSGAVTVTGATSAGINIRNATATGLNADFNGQVTIDNDAAGDGVGVTFTGNGSASSLDFTGGLDIFTTNNPGFVATGGGTVTIQGAGNTITSTTGTAVYIENTNIGAAGITLQSLSANGGTNGILLNNTGTGGFFTVTGDGSTATTRGGNGSGGTIQNTTGAAISLTNASNVTLGHMTISGSSANGVLGSNVTGFTLDRSTVTGNGDAVNEGGLRFTNLLGMSAISNSIITLSAEHNVEITNTSGTLTQLLIDNSLISDNTASGLGADGVLFEAQSSAIANIDVQNSTFTDNVSDGIQINATGSSTVTFDVTSTAFSNGARAMTLANASSADLTFSVTSSTFDNFSPALGEEAINIAMASTSTASAGLIGTVANSTFSNSGGAVGVDLRGNGTATLLIDNNTATTGINREVFDMIFGDAVTDALTANITISNNTATSQIRDVLFMDALSAVTVNADIFGNDFTAVEALDDSIVLLAGSSATFNLVGTGDVLSQLQATNDGDDITVSGLTLIGGPIPTP